METMNSVGFLACIEGDDNEMGDFVLWGQRWIWGFWMELMDRERPRVNQAQREEAMPFAAGGSHDVQQ
nr:hypothetical protein CFP56_79264 [Quercus suber]